MSPRRWPLLPALLSPIAGRPDGVAAAAAVGGGGGGRNWVPAWCCQGLIDDAGSF